MTNTPNNLLHMATREFEATFHNVMLGTLGRTFLHVDGSVHEYIVVCSDGIKQEGETTKPFDSAEEAIKAWRDAVVPYQGKRFLYWRDIPEIEQDTNHFDVWSEPKCTKPNPTFGKWRVYSRFQVI